MHEAAELDKRPLRKDAARNRARLIEAAREVFAARGFEASMDDIAHHAGLGVGTAYRHFANKYELANAIFDNAVDAFVSAAEQAQASPDAGVALRTVLEQTLVAQTGNRAIREILLAVNQGEWEHHDQMIATLVPVFERAKQEGAIRADAEFTDIGLMMIMLCAVTETATDTAPELWRRYLPTLLAGLRPGGPPMDEPALTAEQLRAGLAVPIYESS
jgi:AcrR family transcriptional regulator